MEAEDKEIRELLELIKERSGLSEEEIWRKIREDEILSGPLVSRKGALILLASELGIDLSRKEEFRVNYMPINTLVYGMRRVRVVGRLRAVLPTVTFKRKEGQCGLIKRAVLADKTGEVTLVFWNEAAKAAEGLSMGDVLIITSGRTVKGLKGDLEIHLDQPGSFEVNPSVTDADLIPEVLYEVKSISELKEGDRTCVLGFVIDKYGERRFVSEDGEERTFAALELADRTGRIRTVFWDHILEYREAEIGKPLLLLFVDVKSSRFGELEAHVRWRSQVLPGTSEIAPLAHLKGLTTINELKAGEVNSSTLLRVFHSGESSSLGGMCFVYDATGIAKVILDGVGVSAVQHLTEGCFAVRGFCVKDGPIKLLVLKQSTKIVRMDDVDRFFPSLEVLHPRRAISRICPGRWEIRGTVIEVRKCNLGDNLGVSTIVLLIDDGTGVIRVILKGELTKRLADILNVNVSHPKTCLLLSDEILGREYVFFGSTVLNSFDGVYELYCSAIQKVNPIFESLLLLKAQRS